MTTTPAPTKLHAVTREVWPLGQTDADLLDALIDSCTPHGFAWLHHDIRLVATGVAARVAPSDVADALAAIEVEDPLGLPGTGAIAVGALPFDPSVDGELVIPARVLGQAHGRAWVTEIGPADAEASASHAGPARFTVGATRTRAEWEAIVARAIDAIRRGELEKVVLAREVIVEGDQPFDVRDVIARLVHQQPGCFVYASDGLVGASPELLVRRTGTVVESRPVAGTAVAEGEESLRALAESVKDTQEHRFVVDAIVDVLARRVHGARRRRARGRGVRAHRPSRHPGARHARGRGARRARARARMLSPTPAVGGTPRAAALAAIRELEGFDRGRYAGPVGWVDATRRRRVGHRAARRRARRHPGPARRGRRASSPAPTPPRSGPRPRRSWSRCSAPSSAPERRTLRIISARELDDVFGGERHE